jgi:hypothetical protein
VTTPDPRDRAIEAVLRHGQRSGPASGECLDAETLAAWADGGLDATAMQQAEAHMATCARCQAVMATLVADAIDEPEAAAADGSGRATPWWSFDIRWLMPLAGAVTALLIWLVLPEPAPEQMARVDAPAQTVPREPSAAAPPSLGLAAPPAQPVESPAARQADQPAPPPAEPAPPVVLAERDRLAKSTVADASRGNEARQEVAASDSAEKATSPAVAGAPAALPPPVATARRTPSAPAPGGAASAPAAAAKAIAPAAESRNALADRGAAGIESRDAAVRWRFAGPGIVERSANAGASWEALDTGLAVAFTAGSAPSASVCWVVGGGGVVLVTTDARTWRRVPVPTSEDLVSVEAASDRAATIRTASGQSFQTTDAGVSWAIVR